MTESIFHYLKWALTTKPSSSFKEVGFFGKRISITPSAPFFSKPGFFYWATFLWLNPLILGVELGGLFWIPSIILTVFGFYWFIRASIKANREWMLENYNVEVRDKESGRMIFPRGSDGL